MKRKPVAALALVVLALSLASPGVMAAEVVTLRVAHHWGPDIMDRQLEFDRKFMERYPHIKIEHEITPWGQWVETYLVQAVAGVLPDVMYIDATMLPALQQQNAFLNLDPFIERDGPDFNIDDFHPALLGFYQDREGRQVALPYGAGTIVLFYNKAMFDNRGVAYPDLSWRWEHEFLEAAQKLTRLDAQGAIVEGGTGGPILSWATDGVTLRPWGARLVNDDSTESLVDRPEAIQAIEWWASLFTQYNVVGGSWGAGTRGMMFSGTWDFTSSIQAGLEWDIAHLPAGPVTRSTTYSAGSGYGIGSSTQHPEEAWLYLSEFLGTENQVFMFGSTRRDPPSRRSAWYSFIEQGGDPQNVQVVFDAIEYSVPTRPMGINGSRIHGIISGYLGPVFNGQVSAAQAASDLKIAIDALLAEALQAER